MLLHSSTGSSSEQLRAYRSNIQRSEDCRAQHYYVWKKETFEWALVETTDILEQLRTNEAMKLKQQLLTKARTRDKVTKSFGLYDMAVAL